MTPTQKAIATAIGKGLEVCICAAIRWNGQIWLGHRHGNARDALRSELQWTMNGKEMSKANFFLEENQGFVTSLNRFVNRQEAFALHMAAGIPSAATAHGDDYRGDKLFSEDLY